MRARCACTSASHSHGARCAFNGDYACAVCGEAMCWDCWRKRNLRPVILPEGDYAQACGPACHYALAIQATGGYAAHLSGELAGRVS